MEKAGPEREDCPAIGSSCLLTECCNIMGYTCSGNGLGTFTSSIPGVDDHCVVVVTRAPGKQAHDVPGVLVYGTTLLFCVTLYVKSEGKARAKQFYDLSLVRSLLSLGASFGCEEHKVCSDFHMWLSPGTPMYDGTKKWKGTWYDSPLYTQVWKAIHTQDLWAYREWAVEVHADAVFLPMWVRIYIWGQRMSRPRAHQA